MRDCWKLDVTCSVVFNVNYFLLGTIKVAKELLVFLASLTEDLHFFLPSHHRLMPGMRGRMDGEAPQKNGNQNWIANQQRTFKRHREQSGFDQPLSRENMEEDRSIMCVVLLARTLQRSGFCSTSQLLLAHLLSECLFLPQGLALQHNMVLPYH